MALHALVSPGGSPGVTTAALAITLTWPRPVMLAECDPGGGDVMAGLFAGQVPPRPGLLGVALEAGRGAGATSGALRRQAIGLEEGEVTRLLLAGITDPRQGPGLAGAWPALAAALAQQPYDVIADCGRLDTAVPLPVLAAATTVTMILRPSLRQVRRAQPRTEMLSQIAGSTMRTGILVTGRGPYSTRDVTGALEGIPCVGVLPHDPKTAAVLSDGEGSRRGLERRPLIGAARAVARALSAQAPQPDTPERPVPSQAGPA